jgi:hypothetical protein
MTLEMKEKFENLLRSVNRPLISSQTDKLSTDNSSLVDTIEDVIYRQCVPKVSVLVYLIDSSTVYSAVCYNLGTFLIRLGTKIPDI